MSKKAKIWFDQDIFQNVEVLIFFLFFSFYVLLLLTIITQFFLISGW